MRSTTDQRAVASVRRGQFRAPGRIHLHLDIPPSQSVFEDVKGLCADLLAEGAPAKLTTISCAIVGGHVAAPGYRGIYRTHTPGLVDLHAGDVNERFGAFLSVEIAADADSRLGAPLVEDILARLVERARRDPEFAEIAVEVENVIAAAEGGEIAAAPAEQRNLFPFFGNAPDGSCEIHHAIDFPPGLRGGEVAMLRTVNDRAAALGLEVGGWFVFVRDDSLSLRSVRFVRTDARETFARECRSLDALCSALADFGARHAHSVLEQVMGVWKIHDILGRSARAAQAGRGTAVPVR